MALGMSEGRECNRILSNWKNGLRQIECDIKNDQYETFCWSTNNLQHGRRDHGDSHLQHITTGEKTPREQTSCCLSDTAQWPGIYTWELAFSCRKPVFFPSMHITNFMSLFPVVVLLFPKLIYLQSTHFSQQFRPKWILLPFICLIFIWSIFALLPVIPVCYCLLCIQMHLLSWIRVSNSFQSLSIPSIPCPPQQLLSNLSCSRRIFHTFVFLAKWKKYFILEIGGEVVEH